MMFGGLELLLLAIQLLILVYVLSLLARLVKAIEGIEATLRRGAPAAGDRPD